MPITAQTFIDVRWQSIPSILAIMPIPGREVLYTIITDGKWGSENSPVLIATNLNGEIAEHIVSVHNKAIEDKL